MSSKDFAIEAVVVATEIEPMLAGRGPALQGAVLAQLLAKWLAGHPRNFRVAVLQNHLAVVADLTNVESDQHGTG